jgi:hypothetical protein
MIVRGVAVLVAATLLVGCGGKDTSPDERFVQELEATSAYPSGVPSADRETLISMAHQWCDFLEAPGRTQAEAARVMRRFTATLGTELATRDVVVLGTGANIYCPDAAAKVRGQ